MKFSVNPVMDFFPFVFLDLKPPLLAAGSASFDSTDA